MFYDSELQTDHIATANFIQIKKFWPQGRDCPLAFCNIEGREGGAVSGNKKSSLLSKSNIDEARKVVRFYNYHYVCTLSTEDSKLCNNLYLLYVHIHHE